MCLFHEMGNLFSIHLFISCTGQIMSFTLDEVMGNAMNKI